MIEKMNLYCPNLRRKLKISVSIPKNYKQSDVEFDALYMLDGQNIFKDSDAAFGRSLRMGKYLAIMARKYNKRICCIAIHNSESDLGRINEYTPFPIEMKASEEWDSHDLSISKAYTKDFISTIIPYINSRYPIKKNPQNNFIMGSSLGALYAIYIANTYPKYFSGVGLFSPATFLCKTALRSHLTKNLNKNLRSFIYVGLEETSDDCFDKSLYFDEAKMLYSQLKENNCKTRLSISSSGTHDEETWEKHIMEFLSFMYYDDIILS